jgi:nitrile hydratase accessory protein
MSDPQAVAVLDAEGAAAPPRQNGELVFREPWESRVFGVTISLHRAGLFEWDEFRRLLIAEIAAWERRGRPQEEWSYYERWQAALEQLLVGKRLCAPGELSERVQALAARPAGHDHRHDHR